MDYLLSQHLLYMQYDKLDCFNFVDDKLSVKFLKFTSLKCIRYMTNSE